jgi:hypothetical protein
MYPQYVPQMLYFPFYDELKIFVHTIPDNYNLLNPTPFLWANQGFWMFITLMFWAKMLGSRGVNGTAVLVTLRTVLPKLRICLEC